MYETSLSPLSPQGLMGARSLESESFFERDSLYLCVPYIRFKTYLYYYFINTYIALTYYTQLW